MNFSNNKLCQFCGQLHNVNDGVFDCIYISCSCVLGFFDCALSLYKTAPEKCENCNQKVINFRQLQRNGAL